MKNPIVTSPPEPSLGGALDFALYQEIKVNVVGEFCGKMVHMERDRSWPHRGHARSSVIASSSSTVRLQDFATDGLLI
jgi:hypothetical protein